MLRVRSFGFRTTVRPSAPLSILVVVVMCGLTSDDGLFHCVGMEGFLHVGVCQGGRSEAGGRAHPFPSPLPQRAVGPRDPHARVARSRSPLNNGVGEMAFNGAAVLRRGVGGG